MAFPLFLRGGRGKWRGCGHLQQPKTSGELLLARNPLSCPQGVGTPTAPRNAESVCLASRLQQTKIRTAASPTEHRRKFQRPEAGARKCAERAPNANARGLQFLAPQRLPAPRSAWQGEGPRGPGTRPSGGAGKERQAQNSRREGAPLSSPFTLRQTQRSWGQRSWQCASCKI